MKPSYAVPSAVLAAASSAVHGVRAFHHTSLFSLHPSSSIAEFSSRRQPQHAELASTWGRPATAGATYMRAQRDTAAVAGCLNLHAGGSIRCFQRPERHFQRPASRACRRRRCGRCNNYSLSEDTALESNELDTDNDGKSAEKSLNLTALDPPSTEPTNNNIKDDTDGVVSKKGGADGTGANDVGAKNGVGYGRGRRKTNERYLSTRSKRLSDMFPLLSAEEMRKLLNPEDPKRKNGTPREDTLALLVKDVRELVEELMERVGTTEDKALSDLKEVTEKFKGVLKGDPAAVADLREKVIRDLEEVKDEIEELLELKQLTKARAMVEKATAKSTEMVFDSAVTALTKGLDTVISGKDAIKEGEETETLQVSTYFYGKENEFWEDMQASGVTPRRVFLYTLLAGGLALGGNLFGMTSGLLGTVAPGAARDARLDVLFPVKGFKRFYSGEDGYEFIYPEQWVGDSGLELRRQRDAEDARAPPSAVTRARQRRAAAISPTVGFGPQGTGGDGSENVSVVKSELMGGFSLKGTMGEPGVAAEKLLSTIIAPESSGREWQLMDAFGEERAPGGLVYQFEYRVRGKGIRRPMRNVGVVAARGSTLFTVTVLAPEENWSNDRGKQYRQMARSFRLTF